MKRRLQGLWTSPTVRVVSGLAGGNLLGTLLGVIGSLVQARYVSPEDLGYFRGFSIATGYVFFLHLGILDAFQRYYPLYIGRGEKDRARAVAEVCQAWNATVSAILSGGFLVLATYSLAGGNWRAALGWLVQSVSVVGFIYGGFLGATYRSGHDFTSVAKGSVISSIIGLFTLPLFLVWPYVALAFRSCAGTFVNLVYLHIRRPLRLNWRFTWKEWSGVIGGGVPIFIASYGAATGWSVVETSIILKSFGTKALGLWSISFMLLEAANKVPQAMVAVYVPRVIETLGRTGSVSATLRLCKKPLLIGIPLMFLMVVTACATLPFITPVIMPKYTEAVPTMCLMLLILPLIVLDLPYMVLVALGRVVQQNIAVYAGLGTFVILAMTAVRLDWGLNGVVVSSLLGRVVRTILVYSFVLRNRRYEILKGVA